VSKLCRLSPARGKAGAECTRLTSKNGLAE
jgi:hypothetical protein